MLCFSFTLLAVACGTSIKQPTPNLTAEQTTVLLSPSDRIEVFENVWKTINDEYYEPHFLELIDRKCMTAIAHESKRQKTT